MKTSLTAKLKLTTTPDQFAALRRTQLEYRDALNSVDQYAFAYGKTSTGKRLQAETTIRSVQSLGCPRCGLTSKDNRPNHGLLFICTGCHDTLHADLIGARNVALRTLLVRQDWASTGTLSECLAVTDDEAKARQQQRHLNCGGVQSQAHPREADLGS